MIVPPCENYFLRNGPFPNNLPPRTIITGGHSQIDSIPRTNYPSLTPLTRTSFRPICFAFRMIGYFPHPQ